MDVGLDHLIMQERAARGLLMDPKAAIRDSLDFGESGCLFAYALVIVVVAMWLGFVMFWLLASWHNLSKHLFFVLNSMT